MLFASSFCLFLCFGFECKHSSLLGKNDSTFFSLPSFASIFSFILTFRLSYFSRSFCVFLFSFPSLPFFLFIQITIMFFFRSVAYTRESGLSVKRALHLSLSVLRD